MKSCGTPRTVSFLRPAVAADAVLVVDDGVALGNLAQIARAPAP